MSKRMTAIVLVLLPGLFILGLWLLFQQRIQFGDVYAPYSSLRADPLGTMALGEALERLPGVTVRRDYSTQNKLPDGPAVTYLHIGARSRLWRKADEEIIREAERFAVSGGRLVILFYPESAPSWKPASQRKEEAKEDKKEEKSKRRKERPTTPLEARWKFGLDYADLKDADEEGIATAVARNAGIAGLPATLEWHSAVVFTNLAPDWRPVYRLGTNVVMAELRRGTGSVVIGTDSYYLSNEALSRACEPDLLAWLAGPCREVVFDEAHLGTMESSGVAALMRKYRLGWLIAALLLLAFLYVWKESSRFAPRPPARAAEAFVRGKSASSGFINLLRRNVPARDLPRVCLDQWKSAFLPGARAEEKAAAAESLMRHVPAQGKAGRDPITVYNELCVILKTRSKQQ